MWRRVAVGGCLLFVVTVTPTLRASGARENSQASHRKPREGQRKVPQPNQTQCRPPDLTGFVASAGLRWILASERQDSRLLGSTDPSAARKTSLDAVNDVDAWLEKHKSDNNEAENDVYAWLEKRNSGAPCYGLLAKYRPNLTHFLEELDYAPGDDRGLYYDDFPFVLYSVNKQPALIFSWISSDSVYNTLRLSARERAAKEFHASIVPVLIEMSQQLSDTSFGYYGASVVYGSKDFTEEDSTAKADALMVVASSEDCRKTAKAEITEQELADRSQIYLMERQGGGNILRVKIQVE